MNDLPVFNIQETVALLEEYPGLREAKADFKLKLPYPQFVFVFNLFNTQNLVLVSADEKKNGSVELDMWQRNTVAGKTVSYNIGQLFIPDLIRAGTHELELEYSPPEIPKGYFVPPRDMLITLVSPIMQQCIFAIKLMHCKNVEYWDYDPNKGIPWKGKKKGKKKPKPPFLKYKILQINPLKARKQEVGQPKAESENTRRVHTVRGHFKTYTEARPLFGRYVGTYWWGPCVKGNPDFGLVEKDYHIKIDRDFLKQIIR